MSVVEAHRLPSWADWAPDVVIIGAGPAGMAVAHGLLRSGLRVAILESGGLDPAADLDLGRGLIDGDLPYFDLANCRPRGLGGSSSIWGGWCEPIDDFDFKTRPEHGTTGWCIGRDALDPYYERARQFCGISSIRQARSWLHADTRAARESPFELRTFPVVGPRQLGMRHAGMFAEADVRLVLGATVLRIEMNPDGSAVDHLLVGTMAGLRRMEAGSFIVAAGGIETARLLLVSSGPTWPLGVGNANDLVGRCFMEHPHVDALRLRADAALLDTEFFSERPFGGWPEREPVAACGALVLRSDICHSQGIGRAQVFIEPAGDHTQHPLPRRRGSASFRVRQRSNDEGQLAVIVASEQMPNHESRISLDSEVDRYSVPLPRLHWTLSDLDHRTVTAAADAAARLTQALGAIEVRRRIRRAAWPLDTLGGPHHLGTARMAQRPTDGVVDEDCRVHDVRNLYIASGAVFPTSGHAPPTLTLIALALRLADRLRENGAGDRAG